MPNGVIVYEVVADLLARYSGEIFWLACLVALFIFACWKDGLRRR